MHIHHFTLKKVADLIREQVLGGVLVEAFTQDKDQLIMGLATPEEELWLRISCGAPLPYVWPVKTFHKARRNVLDLLPDLRGRSLRGVKTVAWDRVVSLDFGEGWELILKMHGIQSNLLVLKDGKVRDLFRKGLEQDWQFSPEPGNFDDSWLGEAGAELEIGPRLRKMSPVLDRNFVGRMEFLVQNGSGFAEAFRQCMSEVEDDQFFLFQEKNRLKLSLLDPAPQPSHVLHGLANSLGVFFRSYFQFDTYQRHYRKGERLLSKHLGRYEGQINSYYASIEKIENERPASEIGDLLMANLHQVPSGAEKVELHDFYRDQPIVVKLRPDLNPQQNAQRYYQKQKKHKARMGHLLDQIERLEEERDAYSMTKAAFDELDPPEEMELGENGFDYQHTKDMQAFVKQHMALLEAGKPRLAEKKHPFLEFRKGGFAILCGKNARQNDTLTFHYSKKNDLWLHARDAFGSHVIVSNPTGQDLPREVLEYAASLAAGLSKRKREALVPVQYTERKYVRKVKNGAPGQVIVNREKVVMVEPLDIH